MDYSYLLTPFIAWFCAGVLKFTINSLKAGRAAFGLVGYGGLPSNHSAIVSSMVALIGFKAGIDHPAFGAALTFAFIVLLDANSLRREVGKHAKSINALTDQITGRVLLRERMGHTKLEIAAGVLVGIAVAWLVYRYMIPLKFGEN